MLDKTREKNKKKWGKRKAGAHHASAKISFDDLSSASDASFSDVSGSDDESDTAAAAAVHFKRGKLHGNRKRFKRKAQSALANLAHVSKNAVVPKRARSSAAQVSNFAQSSSAHDNEDSKAETRQIRRKSKKSREGNRGPCSYFGMAANDDDSDDADDDEDDTRIRRAFQSASAGTFPFGSGGRASSCMMARAKSTYGPDHVSCQAFSSRAGSAFSVQVVHLVSPQDLR